MVRRIFTNVLTAKKCDGYVPYQELESLATIHNMLHEPKGYAHELHRYALSVSRTVAFGKRVTSSSSQFATDIREVMENFSKAMTPGKYLFEAVPMLRKLPRFAQPWLKELEKFKNLELSFALTCYRDAVRQAELHPDRPCMAREVKAEMEKAQEEDEVQASSTCMEILGAGSETTASALHFTILALATHPEVVEKAHQELDRVIGQDRFPTWADEPNLPYIRAIIKENQRWRSISPMSKSGGAEYRYVHDADQEKGFPHYTSKDDVYNGYYIPKNCVVRVNHWYSNPEKFDPDRFIDHTQSAAASANAVDASGRDHFSYGGGKRICPGIHLAERSLFMMTSRMLQTFKFGRPLDPKSGTPRELTVDDVGVSTSLIMTPGSDFDVSFEARSEKIGQLLEREWLEKVAHQDLDDHPQADCFTPPADFSESAASLDGQQEAAQGPSPSSELFTSGSSLLPLTFTGLDGEGPPNYHAPAGLEQNEDNLFLNFGGLSPDWIFSIFDPCSHLDTFSFPADCEILDEPTLPLTAQNSSPNAQEPPVKYSAGQGPHLDNWLLSTAGTNDTQSLVIPQLGGNGDKSLRYGSHFQMPKVVEAQRSQLLDSAQAILERPLWKAVSLANFPSKAKLDHCIDLFFVHFRPPISFIHRPTLNPTTISEVLLLSIVAIGARFSSMPGARIFANSIAELNRRILLVMNEQDPSHRHSEDYLTAQLLQAMHGRASGHRILFGHSRDLRSTLVRHAREAGLFQEPKPRQNAPDDCSATTESRWLDWVATERHRRLGWAIYDLDATVGILHNERPAFSIGDIALSLPDEDACWEAPTAHSWIALRPWQPSHENRIEFRKAARECFYPSSADNLELSDDQHLHIITVTLCRFLWSMKELQGSPLMDAVPEDWPLVNHKRTLLNKLDQFLTCPEAAKANKDDGVLRRIVERLLIIHLCHLFGAGDLMDWLLPLLRAGGQHKESRARMSNWGREDGVRLRQVAYHSAQILALSRSFPFNSPCESFYAFYAGGALWCATVLLGESEPGIGTEACDDEDDSQKFTVLQLDAFHPLEGDDYSKLHHWLCEGGQARVGLFGVPRLGSKDSHVQVLQEALRILQNMRIWELSKAFSEFIRKLITAESGVKK
ncbi:cytochrome P450 monooxygenase [Fusarium tjaetaba]|uniref:Cytochrome P450 monooxygenase n=1 Tax=Fusarium tjaetaba TaxID=1567544 RepID=A0A8H5RR55_9HYPO|nr:cytochrome P450 monooxygenase [Fusarium tjaetaba]KAF5636967.1 cytochrome P450 monooxygenase [Fusarium tjaetaba]